ncbi:MAG TPA: phosphatidylserine decarboxylase family protein [Clostridia bacterium]
MKITPLPIAREGLGILSATLATAFILYLLSPWTALLPALLALFLLWFFRNPRRKVTADPSALLSPADGKVLSVAPVTHDDLLDAPAVRITIFLSVLNVHINRAPCTGTVTRVEYREGKFLPAYKSHASELNERNAVVIDTTDGRGRVRVNQITGMLARRIVCDVHPGDSVTQGMRFGMIKLGSCTELIVPPACIVDAKPGQTVHAGLTVLARWQ